MLEDFTEEVYLVQSIALILFKLTIRRLWSNHQHIELKSLVRSLARQIFYLSIILKFKFFFEKYVKNKFFSLITSIMT